MFASKNVLHDHLLILMLLFSNLKSRKMDEVSPKQPTFVSQEGSIKVVLQTDAAVEAIKMINPHRIFTIITVTPDATKFLRLMRLNNSLFSFGLR